MLGRRFQLLLVMSLMQATVVLAAVETAVRDRRTDAPRAGVRPRRTVDAPRPSSWSCMVGDSNTIFANAVQFEKAWLDAIVAYPNGEPRRTASQRGWQTRIGQYDDRT